MLGESPQPPRADEKDELEGQGTAPKQQADAYQTQHTTPVSTGSGEGSDDLSSALGQGPDDLDPERRIAALMDVVEGAFQYADEAANRAQRAAARSSTQNEERLEAVMHAAHKHWLVAESQLEGAREAHADGQVSRLEYHAAQAISAAVDTQRAAGVATSAEALREVLYGLKPAAERARLEELDKRRKAELDRTLTSVTRMDATNRGRLQRARWHAERAVPELGWWPALAADMAHAYQGHLWLDDTGTPRLLKKTREGRIAVGRKVRADRVAMLRTAGFLVAGADRETSTPLRPSRMGAEALYLTTLYPEGLHADARAAYDARFEKARRPWMNNEDRKSAARRLPPLDRYAGREGGEKPVLLEADEVPQASTEEVDQHADMAELAQRFGYWAAMSQTEKFDVVKPPGAARAQEPEALARELGQNDVGDERAAAAPSRELPMATGQNTPLADTTLTTTPDEASTRMSPTADNLAATDLPGLTAETAAPPLHKLSDEATASPAAAPLGSDWDLALADVGAPHSAESAAAAWALRGVLADSVLIDLMASADEDEAFARWKSQHMAYYGEATGHVNETLAPGNIVSYKKNAKHFEAQIAGQRVDMTWERVRSWLRDATTPEALSLLLTAKEAGARLDGGSRGNALFAATGELALARDLRSQIERVTTQALDHVVQFMATTPVPTGHRGKPSPRAAGGALFDLTEAPPFDLPGADQVRADLDRLISHLPDPHAVREPQTVPLSELSDGMVLDRDDKPVVITEIVRHPRHCDIIGEFRGPLRPGRIKHSIELSEQDPDPRITLAPLLPSLYELTGQQPEPDDEDAPGPLVEGHPAPSASAAPRPRGEATPPEPRLPDLAWGKQRLRAHGQALAASSGRPPSSTRRRDLDPDDPYAQFTDNLEHQQQQLADHPDEHTAVASAAREIRETVADLAARARAYTTQRLRTAEGDPAQLLQLTLEPSQTAPFVRVAMNAIMRAIDTAEASVPGARAKARVRAALAATVCSSPPRDPQGDSARDFGDALVAFKAVESDEQDTVAELLAGPEHWAHFADIAAHVEAATANPDPNPPAPRFASVEELRAHLAHLAVQPQPNNAELDPAGLVRYELRGRAEHAGELATDPTLELTPSRRLAIYGSAGDGWRVVAPGSADNVVPWPVKTRRHALRYAALLEALTDSAGNAYPWDADDFPPAGTPYEPQGGHLLYDWVKSNHSHAPSGFRHALRLLRESSRAHGWMEDLRLYRFSEFDYIHPETPEGLQPGDEVMFTFDQDELDYASSLAGYFPPLRGGTLAIGTAVVDENRDLIPGYWWPHRHPEQMQQLTKPVSLRDGARRPRPGEYTLHAGIMAHLPELAAAHQAGEMAPPSPAVAAPDSPRVENSPAAAPGERAAEPLRPERSGEAAMGRDWSADAPPAPAEAPLARRANLAQAPGATPSDAPAPAAPVVKAFSKAPAQESAGQSNPLDAVEAGAPDHAPVQGGADRAEPLAGGATPEGTEPGNQSGASSEPPAAEDGNEYGRGRYVPWGWSVSQGMTQAIDQAKAQPVGSPDPPVFSEAVPSKVKTAHLTEPQLIRRLLSLDEYLTRWRAAEPVEAPRTKKARDNYAKRAYSLVHRYQDVLEEFDDRRAQRRNIAKGRRPGPGEVLFGELVAGDRVLVTVHGQEGSVPCTIKRRSPEGYGVVGLDTTEDYRYENRYMPVRRADATQVNDRGDDTRILSYLEEEYGLLHRWLIRHSHHAEGREGVRARAIRLTDLINSKPNFTGTLPLLPAAQAESQQPALPSAHEVQLGAPEQTALFPDPTTEPPPVPDTQNTATQGTDAATDVSLPRYSQVREQTLNEIVRGNITEADGVFMQRVPRRSIRPASSPQHISAVLNEGLAERTGELIQLSELGRNWYAHYKVAWPSIPRDIEAVERAPLPPIDFAPLGVLPVPGDSPQGPRPPAPKPLPDAWYRSAKGRSKESLQGTYAMAADAAERAAHSTPRNLADIAAGPDHKLWTHQHPLAQYDENAAAALEAVTDPVTHRYATQAVLHLRTALEEAGKNATDHYVQNVRNPHWKTERGSQSDFVHEERARGIVVTYLLAVREHAEAHHLDADTVVEILEDAAGWTGELRELDKTPIAYPYLPAAESVAKAAQHVANALASFARGETDTVDTVADRRKTWRTVEPRPTLANATSGEEHDPVGAGGTSVADREPPGPDASPAEKVRSDRRFFDLSYRVGQFVDYRDDQGAMVTSRVVSNGVNLILRDDDGHEFSPPREFQQSRFVTVREDDGSALPPPAWTATLPDGYRAVAPDQVKPGDVVHDYRANGELWTSRLVIEVKHNDGKTDLTTVGLNKFSGIWLHYDHRTVAVLDGTEHSHQLAETALRGREVRNFAKVFNIPLDGIRIRPATAAILPTAPLGKNDAPLVQQPAAPDTPDADADAAADATSATHHATAADAGGPARAGADASTRTQPVDHQDHAQGQEAQAQPAVDGQMVERPAEPRTAQEPPEASRARQPAAPVQPDDVLASSAPDAPAPRTTGPTESASTVPGPIPDGITQEDSTDTAAGLAENAAVPAGRDEEPSTDLGTPTNEAATTVPGDRSERAVPELEASPLPHPPAAEALEEGTVAISTPSNVTEEPTAPRQNTPRDAQLALETAAPYPDAAAYATAHEALLRELDRHESWLARTPVAAAAANALAGDRTLGPPGLTALLALQDTLASGPDDGMQRADLGQRLSRHVRCAQLAMAKDVLGDAARSTRSEKLRELHHIAFRGQFIAFVQQTEDGEMELGQYIQHRDQQLTQQRTQSEKPAEESPATAQEATTMAVDPDDDSQLPVFERPGEIPLMTAAEAAPRLLAQAQTHLASGTQGVGILAHIYGRPVYALVDQVGASTPSLMLGLAAKNKDGSARPVTIRGDELAAIAPETLMRAVTAWLNASDAGDRPLLDYAPSTAVQAPVTLAPDQGPNPTEAEQPAAPAAAPPAPAATTTTATAPTPPMAEVIAPPPPQAEPDVPAAPEPDAAPEPEAQAAPDAAAGPPAPGETASPPEVAVAEKSAAPISPPASSAQPDAAAKSADDQQGQDGAQQGESAPAAPTEQPAPTEADPAGQLTALARATLTKLDVPLEATGVLIAPRTVVITLESSGNAEHDRQLADSLRTALHEAIRQHPDQSLAAYRIDFQHTPQVGQGSLQEASGSNEAPIPRERLIVANTAAARIFAERLQSDPNAELARTYLTEERQLPPEVQQEWILGYAPSDRNAKPKRWDVLCKQLLQQGFTEEELLQAGLADRNRYGGLYDSFDDRIIFPIHDANAEIVGFGGRRIDRPGETEEQAKDRQSAKYINTRDTDVFAKGDLVFGLHHPAQAQALAESNGPRVSVEGYTDVIAVVRAAATVPLDQRPVAGALSGTAFTERQLTRLRALDTDNPRPHIAFLDNDASGRKVLLDKSDLLLQAPGPTEVTAAPDAKDAARLWEEGIKTNGDGATPVLQALEHRQPLLNATVDAVLLKNANESERANHAFDPEKDFNRTRAMAAQAARYIRQAVQAHSPANTTALEQAALTWAKRLHREWRIPGHMTATAVLLGPGNHDQDHENEVYEHALELLAADPENYFANDTNVRDRASVLFDSPDASVATPANRANAAPDTAGSTPGQWPTGTRGPTTSKPTRRAERSPKAKLALTLVLPAPASGELVELTDRTTAAQALHTAVWDRLGQHAAETPQPNRLPTPHKLGAVHGIDLATSGDDQASDDPTIVLWLGPSHNDSLRLSSSRLRQMPAPALLAAVEWRAAQAADLLGPPLSQTWRAAVRSIIPSAFPARPTPRQLADLLDTIAQSPENNDERSRRRAEQALAMYTAGHADLALDHLAATDHIWVLRNDGSWIQEEAPGEPTWEQLDAGFRQESEEMAEVTKAAGRLPAGGLPVDQMPLAADLTVAHHSAHEAVAAMRPYSIGLPGTVYEKITDLVGQMDAAQPALRRLHGPAGERLMNRARASFVRVLEGLATVAAKVRLTSLSTRLERTVARLRGQDPAALPAPRATRPDRRMQDLEHIERDLEQRMAITTTTLAERGELQEQWIINRARWRARYEQLHGQPVSTDFLPDNGLVAGAPRVPNLRAAHEMLLSRLRDRVAELRDTDPHTGEDGNPYDPTADLLNGVAWAYQQRLIGTVPTGPDPQGPIPPEQLRRAALTVTTHQDSSPLTLRRFLDVTAERADRLLQRLEDHQVLGPYRADSPRTILARPRDIDAMLSRPAAPPAASLRKPSEATPSPKSPPEDAEPEGRDADGLDTRKIQQLIKKLNADQHERSKATEPTTPPARGRKATLTEAEANAQAAGQPTSLAPSQS
ncbi:toprim domain-containing protein [Streptomyces lydicus]|uniref:toprim domain-containing protein n=1 Tax=Streptomyces lydicus TaxID=47763 RepID=UPI001010AB05|nr:toprim domain-containing protein [Streptomyces lydicus]MCZ1012128.1 hypothetical protein [Streptomyces lydicus]